MCGLAGILEPGGRAPDPELLNRFNILMAHRGPDGAGVEIDGPVGLAHRRLSILDLSPAAHQPMWDEQRRACLVFNGEIYNFRELRRELEAAGWRFRSTGDTEVLLKACLEWGVPEAARRVNGMFALALWEPGPRRLWLARDRMGIKPLYYTESDGRLAFASEIKPLLECRTAEPDVVTLLDVLASGAPNWGSDTLFAGVAALEPGSWLCRAADGAQTRGSYFRLLDLVDADHYRAAAHADSPALTKTLRGLLEQSVALHMISDAPVAVLVSGGLDSNLIAALALPVNPEVDLYHADVVGPHSEVEAASALARHVDLKLRVCRVEPEQYAGDLAEVAYYNECPSGYHPNDVPFHRVSRLAADHGIKVLLTGEGADELFHGYEAMVTAAGRRTVARLGERAGAALKWIPGGRQLMHLFPRTDPLPGELLCRLQRRALRREALDTCTFLPNAEEREALADSVVACGAHLQSLLHRNDRMGMMERLESRIPYLENDLVRFAINLPLRFKMPRHPLLPGLRHPMRENKWLLRQVGAALLPESLRLRKKLGFPTQPWVHVPMRPEFFRGGFLVQALRIPIAAWEDTWAHADDELRWNAFASEVWGRIFFLRQSPPEVAAAIAALGRSPAAAMAA